jgi:hypothetical protein
MSLSIWLDMAYGLNGNSGVQGEPSLLLVRADNGIGPCAFFFRQAQLVLEYCAQEILATDPDLAIDAGHAAGGFVSRIHERIAQPKPRVERIGGIHPLKILQ